MSDTPVKTNNPVIFVALPGKQGNKRGKSIRVVTGLRWLDLQPGQSANKVLPEKKGQWIKLRPPAGATASRIGFTRESGKLYSLAVLAIPALKRNGYAFVANGDQVSFVACVHGIPALVGDITGTPESVASACKIFLSLHGQDVPPEGWEVIGSPDAPVEVASLLPSKIPRSALLLPTNQKFRTAGQIATFFILGSAALWAYSHWQAEKRYQSILEQNRIAEQARKIAGPINKPEQHPWPALPYAKEFLETCLPLLNAIPMTREGWPFSAGECGNGVLKTEYNRPPGSISTVNSILESVVKESKNKGGIPPTVELTDDGNRIQFSWPIAFPRSGDDELLPVKVQQASFFSLFQLGDRPLKLEKKPDISARTVLTAAGEVNLIRNWSEWHFSVEERRAPDASFFTLPGIRLTSLTLSYSEDGEMSWKTSGQLWALKPDEKNENETKKDTSDDMHDELGADGQHQPG